MARGINADKDKYRSSDSTVPSGGRRNNIVHTMSDKEYKELGRFKREKARKCKDCSFNDGGFCRRYNKWANTVNYLCMIGDTWGHAESKGKTWTSAGQKQSVTRGRSAKSVEQKQVIARYKTVQLSRIKRELLAADDSYYLLIDVDRKDDIFAFKTFMRYVIHIMVICNTYKEGDALTNMLNEVTRHIRKTGCNVKLFISSQYEKLLAAKQFQDKLYKEQKRYGRCFEVVLFQGRSVDLVGDLVSEARKTGYFTFH